MGRTINKSPIYAMVNGELTKISPEVHADTVRLNETEVLSDKLYEIVTAINNVAKSDEITGKFNDINNTITIINTDLTNLKTYVTPEMFGAKGDGITDDYQALKNMFDSKPSIVNFGANKTYMVSKGIVSAGVCDCIIYGNNATIKCSISKIERYGYSKAVLGTPSYYSSNEGNFNAEKFELHDLNIDVNAHTWEIPHNDTIDDDTVDNLPFYWQEAWHGLYVDSVRKVRIYNCKISHTFMSGICLYYCEDALVEDCLFYDISQETNEVWFPLYQWNGISTINDTYFKKLNVSRCKFDKVVDMAIQTAVKEVIINECNFKDVQNYCLECGGNDSIIISKCTFHNLGGRIINYEDGRSTGYGSITIENCNIYDVGLVKNRFAPVNVWNSSDKSVTTRDINNHAAIGYISSTTIPLGFYFSNNTVICNKSNVTGPLERKFNSFGLLAFRPADAKSIFTINDNNIIGWGTIQDSDGIMSVFCSCTIKLLQSMNNRYTNCRTALRPNIGVSCLNDIFTDSLFAVSSTELGSDSDLNAHGIFSLTNCVSNNILVYISNRNLIPKIVGCSARVLVRSEQDDTLIRGLSVVGCTYQASVIAVGQGDATINYNTEQPLNIIPNFRTLKNGSTVIGCIHADYSMWDSDKKEYPIQLVSSYQNREGVVSVTPEDLSDVSLEISHSTLYVIDGNPEKLTISLTDAGTLSRYALNYHFKFTSGSTPTVLTLPEDVITPEDFVIEANYIYEISIVENMLTYQRWVKPSEVTIIGEDTYVVLG